ncbi:MAG TPA: aldehyde dehydrogenase family protein, partial [Thermoleophilaceae bacterium]|nr:aldehyde dehydrogenase family protein [Thermoleophilaceae bacterium]
IAARIAAGSVWINDHSYSRGAFQCPWGGEKSSGVGRSHSRFGFYECVNVKYVAWEPSRWPQPWWHPYERSLVAAANTAAKLLYGRDEDKWKALRSGAVPLLRVGREMLRAALGRGRRRTRGSA